MIWRQQVKTKLSIIISRECVECGLSIIGLRVCIYITLFKHVHLSHFGIIFQVDALVKSTC